MFLTPVCINNRVSNFGSKEWINSKVGLVKIKALVKPQRNNAINCQASEINPELNIWRLDSDFMHFLANLVHSTSGLLLYNVCEQLGDY